MVGFPPQTGKGLELSVLGCDVRESLFYAKQLLLVHPETSALALQHCSHAVKLCWIHVDGTILSQGCAECEESKCRRMLD